MDVLERLNRRFGSWYEGVLGGGPEGATGGPTDLRPRDILRQIVQAMEDGRREGLDGQVYVPNVYTLHLSVKDDAERQYLRTFLSADELADALRRTIAQHKYQVKGSLVFRVEETEPAGVGDTESGAGGHRVRVVCRFDAQAGAEAGVPASEPASAATPVASQPSAAPVAAPVLPASPSGANEADDEPGTIAHVGGLFAPTLATLLARDSTGQMLDVYPLTQAGAQIGRSKHAQNTIVFAHDGMISKTHARIGWDGLFVLTDAQSTNGTRLNGVPIAANVAYPLHAGDEITLGETTLLFRPSEQAGAPPIADASARLAPVAPMNVPRETPGTLAPSPSVASARYALIVDGSGASAQYPLAQYPLASQMSVGRMVTSDIVLDAPGVASRHARLFVRGDGVTIEDEGTDGGTFVNGERIPARFAVNLYDGDQLGFGGARARLVRTG